MRMIRVETPPCIVCKKTSLVDLESARFDRWQSGEHVQNVFPDQTPDERELLLTGTHPACWEEIFSGTDVDSEPRL